MRLKQLYFQQAFLILLIFSCYIPASFGGGGGEEQKKVRFAFLEPGINKLKSTEKMMAFELFSSELVKKDGYRVQTKVIPNFDELRKKIIDKTVDYVFINLYFYIKNYHFFQDIISEPIWAVQVSSKEKLNYVLITKKKDKDKNISQFKEKNLSIHPEWLMMSFYLDYLTKKSSSLNKTQFFKKIKHTKTLSQSVLDVYFGQSDICIVPKYIFYLTAELNPDILNKLTIIHESGELVYPVLSFSLKHTNIDIKKMIDSNFSALDKHERGKQILRLLGLNTVKAITKQQLEPMRELFIKYQTLK